MKTSIKLKMSKEGYKLEITKKAENEEEIKEMTEIISDVTDEKFGEDDVTKEMIFEIPNPEQIWQTLRAHMIKDFDLKQLKKYMKK